MYSHDCQQENLPLRHASLKVLKMNSSLYPRYCAEVDGERLVERWALRNSTSVNVSWYKNIGRTISEKDLRVKQWIWQGYVVMEREMVLFRRKTGMEK